MGIKLKFGKDKKKIKTPNTETDIIDTLDQEIEGKEEEETQEGTNLISTDMAMLNILGELSEDIKKLLRYNEKRLRRLEETQQE